MHSRENLKSQGAIRLYIMTPHALNITPSQKRCGLTILMYLLIQSFMVYIFQISRRNKKAPYENIDICSCIACARFSMNETLVLGYSGQAMCNDIYAKKYKNASYTQSKSKCSYKFLQILHIFYKYIFNIRQKHQRLFS